jgi:hypothetical protein
LKTMRCAAACPGRRPGSSDALAGEARNRASVAARTTTATRTGREGGEQAKHNAEGSHHGYLRMTRPRKNSRTQGKETYGPPRQYSALPGDG